jgi:hypothetical protein
MPSKGFLISCLIIVIVYNFFFDIYREKNIRDRAIETNLAEYNSTTGNFQWLDEDVKYIIKGKE